MDTVQDIELIKCACSQVNSSFSLQQVSFDVHITRLIITHYVCTVRLLIIYFSRLMKGIIQNRIKLLVSDIIVLMHYHHSS